MAIILLTTLMRDLLCAIRVKLAGSTPKRRSAGLELPARFFIAYDFTFAFFWCLEYLYITYVFLCVNMF